jgi:riboflavin kinase/FMN adenylyltransferase
MKGSVLTVGKFESLHKGHQHLFAEATRLARQHKLSSVVATFEPNPRRVLSDGDYAALFTREERASIVHARHDIDLFSVYDFDAEFIKQTPIEFCQRLFADFAVRHLVLGEGFQFGKDRSGSIDTIKQLAQARDIPVHVLDHIKLGTEKISTSRIREHLSVGKLSEAKALLGFDFFVDGRVSPGKQVGKKLGFPTLNLLPPSDKLLPPDGVYATQVQIGGGTYKGVTNVGIRPSFCDGEHRTVETYLPDDFCDKARYGEALRVIFSRFLRPERRFESPAELKAQIARDVDAARV